MEIDFANHSVCVLENLEINCYNISNVLQKTKLPTPDFLPAFSCKFKVALIPCSHSVIYINLFQQRVRTSLSLNSASIGSRGIGTSWSIRTISFSFARRR